ncbi:MAG: alginate export family protein [Methylobacter sp.]
MRKIPLTGATVSHTLSLIVAGSFCVGGSNDIQAAEKKKYSKPPFTVFSSQMQDALLGSDKYEKPAWNLHDTLGLPKWLAMSLEQRTRYETMDGTYKANGKGGDQQIPLQTDLWLQATLGSFRLGAEFLDARALNADSGSGVNNTHANQADFLQGYAAWDDQNVFYSGIGAEVTAGRQTLNFGSRRLVARNSFRNTINNFTGLNLRLLDYDNWQFNGFVTMPVIRYPTAATDILNETHQWDKEDTHTLFSGGFLELYNLGWGINTEMYLYHLTEGDSVRNPTRNRRYFTPGMRFYIKPAKSEFDFQLEAIGQFGTVRATTAATDGRDLQHQAWYQHADVGYTFDMPWSPRLGLEYDYASGDKNPNDNKDQRFDTLYGARRFDYGPTGIYGAFARTNINSPGYRINVSPRSDVQATLSHRIFWLASTKDSWTTAGLQDTTGRSGNFVGHQLDLSVRWDFNSSLNFETGWTHLFKGSFAKNAPSAPNAQDIDYFYVQSIMRF